MPFGSARFTLGDTEMERELFVRHWLRSLQDLDAYKKMRSGK